MYLIFPFFLCLAVGLVMLANRKTIISFNKKVTIILASAIAAVSIFAVTYAAVGVDLVKFLSARGLPNIVMFPLLPAFCMMICFRFFMWIIVRRPQ